jgi:hypothetical protein
LIGLDTGGKDALLSPSRRRRHSACYAAYVLTDAQPPTGKNLAFGCHEVSCGFTGMYVGGRADVEGTALVGKTSVSFHAELNLVEKL